MKLQRVLLALSSKDDGLKKQIDGGRYRGILKTIIDGLDQRVVDSLSRRAVGHVLGLAVLLGTAVNAPAQTDPRIALYGWAPSVAGNLTARGQTVNVNVSFALMLQQSDSLIGYVDCLEADKGRVGAYLDTV